MTGLTMLGDLRDIYNQMSTTDKLLWHIAMELNALNDILSDMDANNGERLSKFQEFLEFHLPSAGRGY